VNEPIHKDGVIITVLAYIIWGFLPLYWKLVDDVSPSIILAERIIWSFAGMMILLIVTRRWSTFKQEFKHIFSHKQSFLHITLASFAISLNWLTYIWAVNNEFVVQASLGYYINPLINIVVGIIILKEVVSRIQIFSFIIAAVGVLYLTISFGEFPWVSFVLAISFAIYGLLKRSVKASAAVGLTIETMIVTPIALIFLIAMPNSESLIHGNFTSVTALLVGTGIATALPLLLFAYGTKRIPFIMLGFLQYIAPTIMLFIGIYIFKETFSTAHFIAFCFIWVALVIYMWSSFYERRRLKRNIV